MKQLSKQVLGSVLVLSALTGCGGAKIRRTVESDPVMRVMIDPRINPAHYVQIRRALVQSGKFEVVDRSSGFEAVVAEQDLQYRAGYQDRFSDREKWAHVGELYGAGGIVSAHADCYQAKSFFGEFRRYCKQSLAMIDGRTGVVMFEVAGENSEPWTVEYTVPDWDEVVAKATDAYPEYFKTRIVKRPLDQYMDQSEERARRERERLAPAPQAAAPSPYSLGASPAAYRLPANAPIAANVIAPKGVSLPVSKRDMDTLREAQKEYLEEQNAIAKESEEE